jgi:hypothetical protein
MADAAAPPAQTDEELAFTTGPLSVLTQSVKANTQARPGSRPARPPRLLTHASLSVGSYQLPQQPQAVGPHQGVRQALQHGAGGASAARRLQRPPLVLPSHALAVSPPPAVQIRT